MDTESEIINDRLADDSTFSYGNSPNHPGALELALRGKIRQLNYSWSTEKTYVSWYRHFVIFHKKKHPSTMGSGEVERFLTHLAVNRNVSGTTQNQALNALVFLFFYWRAPISALFRRRSGIRVSKPLRCIHTSLTPCGVN